MQREKTNEASSRVVWKIEKKAAKAGVRPYGCPCGATFARWKPLRAHLFHPHPAHPAGTLWKLLKVNPAPKDYQRNEAAGVFGWQEVAPGLSDPISASARRQYEALMRQSL